MSYLFFKPKNNLCGAKKLPSMKLSGDLEVKVVAQTWEQWLMADPKEKTFN